MKARLLMALLVLSFGFLPQVFADEEESAQSETKAKLEDVTKDQNADDEADRIITNKRMRAATGSLSKWSVSTSFSYQGGSVERPFDEIRPNIVGALGTEDVAYLSGSVSVKYRATTVDSFNLGFGLRMLTPFHNETLKEADENFEASSPSLSYTRLFKIGNLQNVFSAGVTYYTSEFTKKWGHAGGIGVDHTILSELGQSGLTIGLTSAVSGEFFNKENEVVGVTEDGELVRAIDNQADYSFGFYPFAEYTINDTFSLRTVAGLFVYEHPRANAMWTFDRNVVYQSVGVGISLARDVYLYPNVQFIPDDIRSDRTNVGITATVNIF